MSIDIHTDVDAKQSESWSEADLVEGLGIVVLVLNAVGSLLNGVLFSVAFSTEDVQDTGDTASGLSAAAVWIVVFLTDGVLDAQHVISVDTIDKLLIYRNLMAYQNTSLLSSYN